MSRNISEIVAAMTLEEKAGLCSGHDFWHLKSVERLGVPHVMVSDGPFGLRRQDTESDHTGINDSIKAVCFPASVATASSFDTDLMYELGSTLGQECQAEDVCVLLGPAVNIKRSPLCGRNFEYISEDPYLTGKLAAAYINGVQSWNVGTSIKHFAANNQEYNRMSCSSDLSERTLREIYLPGFEIAVKEAQPKTVMCSYNKINGTYASENHHLLTEILRDEWGFQGYVMSDWSAVADRVEGIRAGLDLEMPASGGWTDEQIVTAVQNGTLPEALLDQAVSRILRVSFSYLDNRHPEAVFDRDADHEKAVYIETESAVLLENNGILPLDPDVRVAYIGAYAEKPRYQGGGSSHINSSRVTSALQSALEKGRHVTYVQGFPGDGVETTPAAIAEAVAAAQAAEVAVIFAGLPEVIESEGYDRKDLKLPACQNALIEAVLAAQPNTVVVLHNGAPVEVPWAGRAAAILELYLGGQGVGEACDRLLYGEVNPSGHLAETFPLRLEDNPSYLNFPGDGLHVNYAEGIYVGYRYYDTKKLPVQWAFGHGLSYTSFAFSDLTLSADSMDDAGSVTVRVTITNTGSRAGRQVAQLYVSDLNGTAGRPVKELQGFAKTRLLSPGESQTLSMTLNARSLSFYHEELGDWYAPSGTWLLQVGPASDEILLTAELAFTTAKILPLHVTGATTVGELLANPITAPFAAQLLQSSAVMPAGENDADTLGSDAEMMASMFYGTPLKAMASFGGREAAGMIGQLIETLNAALDAAQS